MYIYIIQTKLKRLELLEIWYAYSTIHRIGNEPNYSSVIPEHVVSFGWFPLLEWLRLQGTGLHPITLDRGLYQWHKLKLLLCKYTPLLK